MRVRTAVRFRFETQFYHCGRRTMPFTVPSLPMDTDVMDNLLSVMTPAALHDAHRLINACERCGSLGRAEADEWRKRIAARQAFLELGTREAPG